MRINKALNDRTLNVPSGNGNAVTLYRKLISLIDQYNILAKDRGIPIKSIPVYGNNLNCAVISRLIRNILREIDMIGAIDRDTSSTEDEDNGLVKDKVEFTNNEFEEGLWKYTVSNDIAYVSYNKTGGNVNMGASDQPYSRLIGTDGKTYVVTSFAKMFYNNDKVTSISISDWAANNIVDTSFMFSNCPNLTSITINGFNINNTTYMRDMFSNCPKLTSITLNGFRAKSARNLSYMFAGDYKLNSLNLSVLNGEYIMDTSYMFSGCSSLSNLVLGKAHIPAGDKDRTTTGLAPKDGCTIILNAASYDALSSLEFKLNYSMTKWSEASIVGDALRAITVTDLESIGTNVVFTQNVWAPENGLWKYILDDDEVSVLFNNTDKSGTVELSSTDMPYEKLIDADGRAYPVTSYEYLFYNGTKFGDNTQLTISGWTNRNVTDMHNMFYNCSMLKSLTLTKFDTSMVRNMSGMFQGCSVMEGSLSLTSFNTEHVTNMIGMFENCSKLKTIDLSTFNTPVLEEISSMFYNCELLETLTLSDSFTTESVTTMSNMFYNCSKLQKLNLNGFDTTATRYMSSMFYNCSALIEIVFSAKFIPKPTENRPSTQLAPAGTCKITMNKTTYDAFAALEFNTGYTITSWDTSSTAAVQTITVTKTA